MNISSRYNTSVYSFASSSRHNMVPSLSIVDRDAQVQRALLGDCAYLEETDSPSSPLNTPSPTIDGLSPLSVASHLQDACDAPFQTRDVNPFLDPSWNHQQSLSDTDRQPIRLVVNRPSPQRQSWSVPATPEPSAATLLPTIQETSTSSPPRIPRRQKPATTIMNYSLPPSALGLTTSPVLSTSSSSSSSSSSSGPSQMRRRPSPFPLGPVPQPPPQRRARYEPRPHVVDIATEQFGLKTPTISTTSTTTQLQQERERQWKVWDAERQRSLEMTREAAKNNRAPRAVAKVQEKPTVSQLPAQPSKTTTKKGSKWWCFGAGAAESDAEINEKQISRSCSRLSSLSSDSEDDEEEWDAARNLGVATGLFGFSCAASQQQKKNGASRQRATLKKRAL